jgi:hypothetical protein
METRKEMVKTFTPIIPAGTGPALLDPEHAIQFILHEIDCSRFVDSGVALNIDEQDRFVGWLDEFLRLWDKPDGEYQIFPEYTIEIKTMPKAEFDAMPEFDGF